MLFKDRKEYNKLIHVFDYGGFSMYNLKATEALDIVFNAKKVERLIFPLKGSVIVNGENLNEKDMAYVPIDTEVSLRVNKDSVVYIAEAPAQTKYEFYVKRLKDAESYFIDQPGYRRTVVVMIGEGDKAERFIAGYVEGLKGEWTSYPPHKHDDKPEAYIFYGIDPGFGVQLIIDENDERAYVVHDYDVVLIPRGYHPNFSTTLTGINYAWIIAAPPDRRNLTVDVHPAYKDLPLGRSHLKIK
ncbi:MAG: 5-deoxy-glucuronate isomerase [Vulcanisaeta sp.]